ncbi:MAG: adenylate/guanylate cyclase domain-containing protein [Ignavibacteriae bacterium]|nr:adenylate/guanylate cyclase domain-containing protein [Ignavibacteriota bacterium]NOG99404.1 adenylate/guanylate cyclase domain-containing protein [Ignavibacteriota bacterium]
MLSPKTKRNISRIIPFGIIWLVSGLVFLIVEYTAAGVSNSSSTRIEMNFAVFIFSSLAITAVGLLVGTVELLWINKLFSKKSFTKKIIYKTLFYTLILFVITLITFPIAASLELDVSIFDEQVWAKLIAYLTSFTHLSTAVQLAVALIISLFYAEISENIGHGILLNFFTGKYHTPTEENRIFMFMDMKSSTTIAEKLGHIKYFELLREYYSDLSEAIINYSGEIYQYVGDEIVVSWKYESGIENNNCIACFFAMKGDLKNRAKWYNEKFGVVPSFKAGLHFGKVTTGEIGALRREIIFTGDVLNSTSRIQSLCNKYQVDLLISGDLLNALNLDTDFKVTSFGQNELKGKKENVELFAVERNEAN